MKKKVEFSDIEPALKEQFHLLMTNPEAFNIHGLEAQQIKDLSGFAKRAGWKVVKRDAQITLAKQNDDELALSVIEDLEEDGVHIVSKRSLDLLLKHPENPEFCLEEEMIQHIRSLSSKEISGLKHALAHDLNIDEDNGGEKSIGQKILDVFKTIWSTLAPVFSGIVITLAGLVGTMADKAIEAKVGGEIGDKLGDGVDEAIESFGSGLAEAIRKSAIDEEKKEPEEFVRPKNPLATSTMIHLTEVPEEKNENTLEKHTLELTKEVGGTISNHPVLEHLEDTHLVGESTNDNI